MNHSTANEAPQEWHPAWCQKTEECSPNHRHGDTHTSAYAQVNSDPNGMGGESFSAQIQASAYSEEPGELLEKGARLYLFSNETYSAVDLHMSTKTVRALARWMYNAANAIDEVHAGTRTDLSADFRGGAQ